MITIYSRSNCSACTATKMWLTREGFEFVEVDLDSNREETDRLQDMGFRELPVVVVEDEHGHGSRVSWSGFRYSDLRRLRTDAPPKLPGAE